MNLKLIKYLVFSVVSETDNSDVIIGVIAGVSAGLFLCMLGLIGFCIHIKRSRFVVFVYCCVCWSLPVYAGPYRLLYTHQTYKVCSGCVLLCLLVSSCVCWSLPVYAGLFLYMLVVTVDEKQAISKCLPCLI